MTKEALKLALEALEHEAKIGNDDAYKLERDAIKEALAQPEPVAWVGLNLDNMAEAFHRVIEEHHSRKNPFHDPVNRDAMIALRELRGLIAYMKRNTTPPQRTWVGLTDEEMDAIYEQHHNQYGECESVNFGYERAIEAKLKEKNELR